MANDGEVFGLRLALGDASTHMAHLRSDHDALFRDARAKLLQAQATIDELRGERDQARAQVGKLKHALALELCNVAGLFAKAGAYRKLLDRIAPSDKLLQVTGLHYPNGFAQKFVDVLYDQAHDKKAEELGLQVRIAPDAT